MPPLPLRKDAVRNRQKIIDVGRRLVDEGTPIQLNDVARVASVGVATVYRHFPSPEALLETVATPGIEALITHAERTLQGDDPWAALSDYLHAGAAAVLVDASLSSVFASPVDALPHITVLKQRLTEVFGQLLDRAHASGSADPNVTQADLLPLMCGVVYAATMHSAADAEDRSAAARRYLTIVLEGIRTRA
ncbi:TetR/AcrR family transcriptional regulator [Streptomyces chartreusis]